MSNHLAIEAVSSNLLRMVARLLLLWILSLSSVWSSLSVVGDPSGIRLIEELLATAPEPADWREVLEGRIAQGYELPSLPSYPKPPQDLAAPSVHLSYWRDASAQRAGYAISDIAREKILVAVRSEPAAVLAVLDVLPQTEVVAREIAHFVDQGILDENVFGTPSYYKLLVWVYKLSGLFHEEVFSYICRFEEAYRWNQYSAWDIVWERAPEQAFLLSLKLIEGEDLFLQVVGLRMLWLRGDKSGPWRERLIECARSSMYPPAARSEASRALLKEFHLQRDEWMLDTIMYADEWYQGGFEHVVRDEPDLWIPRLVEWVGGENQRAYERSVSLLIKFNSVNAREDALRPLLPWLKDPEWASDKFGIGRLRLVQSLDDVHIPESVEGLSYILANDPDQTLCAYAAESLLCYDVEGVVELLKTANDRLGESRRIFTAIDSAGGFSVEEQVEAVVKVLRQELNDDPVDEQAAWDFLEGSRWSYGDFLISDSRFEIREELYHGLERRIQKLRLSEPLLAASLNRLNSESAFASSPGFVSGALVKDDLTLAQLRNALLKSRDADWRRAFASDPAAMSNFALGCFAVLSRNETIQNQVIAGGDEIAQSAMVACARIADVELDYDVLEGLVVDTESLLGRSIGAYFKDRNDREARTIYIRNWGRDSLSEGFSRTASLESAVSKFALRTGMVEKPASVYALLSFGGWGGFGAWYVLVFDDVSYALRDFEGGRIGLARLTQDQFREFSHFMDEYEVDSLPRLDLPIMDGVQYFYVHATEESFHSVFMNNPPTSRRDVEEYLERDQSNRGIVVYARLVRQFMDLFSRVELELSYSRGLSIVVSRDHATVEHLAWCDGVLLVLVENDRGVRYWANVEVSEGTVAMIEGEPVEFPIIFSTDDMPKAFSYSDYHVRYPWQVRGRDGYVRSGRYDDTRGLWLCRKGAEPELLKSGIFLGELVSEDGRWCVVPMALGASWADPNGMIILDLENGTTSPVSLAPADNFNVLAYLPRCQKFLIYQRRDQEVPGVVPDAGPESPEYYLLDPKDGGLAQVSGDFSPYHESRRHRPHQRWVGSDLFWVAIPDYNADCTIVGRYDDKEFSFMPVQELGGVAFSSMEMWVDEVDGCIYFLVNGDLVSARLVD